MLSPFSSKSENEPMKEKSSGNKSHYILIVLGIILIGTIIAVVYFIKQRRRISPLANRNYSSKSKRGASNISPGSRDNKMKNRDSGASSIATED